MSTQLAFATSATAFNLSRSAERTRRAHLAVLAALAVVVCGATGCSHVVHIDSAPGAEILVNGQSIGRSPATYTETTGAQGSVQVALVSTANLCGPCTCMNATIGAGEADRYAGPSPERASGRSRVGGGGAGVGALVGSAIGAE